MFLVSGGVVFYIFVVMIGVLLVGLMFSVVGMFFGMLIVVGSFNIMVMVID